MTSNIKVSHIPVHSLVRSVLCLQYEIRVLQTTNASEGWQRGYESVRFLARYSFLCRQAGLDEAWAKWWCRSIRYTLAANVASGVGACAGIVEPLKHLLRVIAHPKFLVLELRVTIGACSWQYGNFVLAKIRLGLISVRCSQLKGVRFSEVRNVLVLW